MTLKCIIVDDEKPAREGLKKYVSRVNYLELVSTAKSATEANNLLQEYSIDLLFLDIQMPEITGIELIKSLINPPIVVFTTAYREYAVESFEVNAIDYLVKPISFDRFLKACNKVWDVHTSNDESPTNDYFFVKVGHQYVRIQMSEVCLIEAANDYVFIHTADGTRHITLLSLKEAEKQLPSSIFLKVHRSFIVNKDFVKSIDGNQLEIGNKKVPISRNLSASVQEELTQGKMLRKNG